MSARTVLCCVVAALMMQPGQAAAQGFAGLGTSADGFAVPQSGVQFEFPADHGPHPDYRIEWWYVTANLQAADGTDYGIQWTLFRSALASGEAEGWTSPQVWMGHAALTTPNAHFVSERLARGGIGQAGVSAAPFEAWIDDWHMRATTPSGEVSAGGDGLARLDLAAKGDAFSYDLRLDAEGPLVLQGEGGYSLKSAAGQASYYYSQPFYTVRGTLRLPGGDVAVTGNAWLDREWSSQPLAADQTGWDWFSLHLDSGEKLMGFRLRDSGAGFTSANWIAADGTPAPLPPGAMTVTPLDYASVAGKTIPVRWRVDVPAKGFSVTTVALNPQAYMTMRFPYWEGPIRFSGTHAGRGYLEMTGYE